MKTIHDITVALHPGLAVWEGDPPVVLTREKAMADGEMCNLTRMNISCHTGTHVDAPCHFVDGAGTIEQLDLQVLMGPAVVVDVGEVDLITVTDLAAIPPGTERVLFKSRNSGGWANPNLGFQSDFVAVDVAAAEHLVAMGVKLVGVDYLSVAPYDAPTPTHVALLGAGVIVLEGIDLSAVPAGAYTLTCLPLKIVGSDGAPARAVLTAL
ncbi:MAG: arylformamidase [Candidatus Omnitrophota bacterium]|jgi:arylformamidase